MPSAQEVAAQTRAIVRGLLNKLGYDVHKLRGGPSSGPIMPTAELAVAQLIEEAGPRAVIDVGANTGQFANWVRDSGFKGQIVSFEPQPAEHAELVVSAESDPDWIIAPRCALGATDGTAQLNVAGNSYSSSLLEMLDRHADNAPKSAFVDTVETPLRRLDDVLSELGIDPTGALLKVDTQGFEAEVLRGATSALQVVSAVHIEISLDLLYAGQALASDIFALLAAAGLELTNVNDGFRSTDGRLLQIDGSFSRIGAEK
jgi:FkbM family methyltransferase